MSSLAKWCIDWTIPRLTDAHRQWLNDLPLELDSADGATKNWRAIHGAPIDPNYFYAYVYQMTYEQNLEVMAERHLALCFHGHSHIQGLYVRNKLGLDSFLKPAARLSINDYKHALVCPGAVGQPRDGCIGAQLAIYNQTNQELEFIVVDYDMDKTIQDMQAQGFPETLWQRLKRGT
jgi:diadenosine tetraphosphatase ApaH/serine/threonine PP2A family protein phosphatase